MNRTFTKALDNMTRLDAYNSTRLNAYKKIRRASKNSVSTSRSQCTSNRIGCREILLYHMYELGQGLWKHERGGDDAAVMPNDIQL